MISTIINSELLAPTRVSFQPDECVKHLDNAMAKAYSIPRKQLDSEQWIQKQLYNLKFNKNTYSKGDIVNLLI